MNYSYREPCRVLDEAQIQQYRSAALALQRMNYELDRLLIVLCRSYRNLQLYRQGATQIAAVCRSLNLLVGECEDIVTGVHEQKPAVIRIIVSPRRDRSRRSESERTVQSDSENQPRKGLAPSPSWILQVVTLLSHINRVATYLCERAIYSPELGGGSDCLRNARKVVLRQKRHLEDVGEEATEVVIETRFGAATAVGTVE